MVAFHRQPLCEINHPQVEGNVQAKVNYLSSPAHVNVLSAIVRILGHESKFELIVIRQRKAGYLSFLWDFFPQEMISMIHNY